VLYVSNPSIATVAAAAAVADVAVCASVLQLAMWDELWWDDGLYHSQPVLDGTLEPQLQSQ
jgi:hypothetical protein